MLFLQPPYHLISGIAVFPDSEREDVFTIAPGMPRLSHRQDPLTGANVPLISLMKFRDDAGTGGFLNFSVDLGVEEERLDEVRSELKRIHGLRDDPILSPMLFEDGDIKLMILGAETPSPGAEPEDADDDQRFVVKINHHGKPALFNENNAIFSVELDEDGVQMIEASLRGEMLPIGCIYSLSFLALRSAFRVKVNADWDRVQTHFEENYSASVLFSSLEISESVDKLIEDQAVLIEVDTFIPEGEDDGSWIGHREEAINDFKEMITEAFFEPSLEPLQPTSSDWEDEVHTASQVGLLLASGGWAGVASFSYKKADLTRVDRRTINMEMHERTTVRRHIYPQAHLSGLFSVLRDANGDIDLSRFVTEVTLEDDWFKRREVAAHAIVDFEAENVESLNVSMSYAGRVETVRLSKDNKSETKSWPSVLEAGAMTRDVNYDYSISFRGVDAAERPAIIQSPPMSSIRDAIDVAPQNDKLYFIDDIQIGTGGFPWDIYPSIEVHLRYQDADNGIDLNDSFLLKSNEPECTWKRFRIDAEKDSFEIRRVFHAADNRDRVIEWTELDQERFTLRNPLPMKRTVQVVPAVDWNLVSMIFAELTYQDPANGVFKSDSLMFMNTDLDGAPKAFEVNLVDETQRLVRYSAKILLVDNRQIDIPLSETLGSVVFLRLDSQGHRLVNILSPEEEFSDHGVDRLIVDLSFEDAARGFNFSDRFTFDSSGQSRVFEYDYADPATSAYQITTTEVLNNGMSRRRELGLSVENPLRLHLT